MQLDQIGKSLRKVFSGDLAAADTAIVKGLISATGEVATTEQEILTNRSERLALLRQEFDLQKNNDNLAIRQAAEDNFLAAAKATFGFNVKSVVPFGQKLSAEE